jgi:hypothetical protein
MKRLLTFVVLTAPLVFTSSAGADADSATHYYLSLGDSLASGPERGGDGNDYPEQLFAMLRASDPKLELERLGCGGESSDSMRFGSRLPSVVLSCGSPRYYKNFLFSKGTQLAEAVSFVEAHKGKVALVTIDFGANDLSRFDAQGNLISCLFEPQGCAAQAQFAAGEPERDPRRARGGGGPGCPDRGDELLRRVRAGLRLGSVPGVHLRARRRGERTARCDL